MAKVPKEDPDDELSLEAMKDEIAKTFGSLGVDKIVYDDGEELLDVKEHNQKKAKGMKTLNLKLKVKIEDPEKLRDCLDSAISSNQICRFCETSDAKENGHKLGCPVNLLAGIRQAISGKG